MSSDLLDDGIIEVARVSQEITCNVVCVLDSLENICGQGELPTFPELSSGVLALEMGVLHPAVVVRGSSLRDVFFEDYDIGVWDLYRIR